MIIFRGGKKLLSLEQVLNLKHEQEMDLLKQKNQEDFTKLQQKIKELELENALLGKDVAQYKIIYDNLLQNQEQMKSCFSALSKEMLDANTNNFLNLAKNSFEGMLGNVNLQLDSQSKLLNQQFTPVQDQLKLFNEHILSLEKARSTEYGGIKQEMLTLIKVSEQLNLQTNRLNTALTSPSVKGRWGELQLRRTVEIAGMTNYCDFLEQNFNNNPNNNLRPDMVVNLPDNRCLVIDAKVPLSAYLDAVNTEDATQRDMKFKEHVKQLRAHVNTLSTKKYWQNINNSAEFVILFLPGENFYFKALEFDNNLLEDSLRQNVIIATPASLIGILKAVNYGWRNYNINANTKQIFDLAQNLYYNLTLLQGNLQKISKDLERVYVNFNKNMDFTQSKVLNKFKGLIDFDRQIEVNIPPQDEQIKYEQDTFLDFKEEDSALENLN